MSRAFEVLYRSPAKNETINAGAVSFTADWVVFTSEDYLVVAYPADIIHAVMEVEPEEGKGWNVPRR